MKSLALVTVAVSAVVLTRPEVALLESRRNPGWDMPAFGAPQSAGSPSPHLTTCTIGWTPRTIAP